MSFKSALGRKLQRLGAPPGSTAGSSEPQVPRDGAIGDTPDPVQAVRGEAALAPEQPGPQASHSNALQTGRGRAAFSARLAGPERAPAAGSARARPPVRDAAALRCGASPWASTDRNGARRVPRARCCAGAGSVIGKHLLRPRALAGYGDDGAGGRRGDPPVPPGTRVVRTGRIGHAGAALPPPARRRAP